MCSDKEGFRTEHRNEEEAGDQTRIWMPPVCKWHVLANCPTQQVKPDHLQEKRGKQTNKQTSNQTSNQASKQASKQTNKQPSKQTNKQANKQTNKQTSIRKHFKKRNLAGRSAISCEHLCHYVQQGV